MAALVNDRWMVRRLAREVASAGFAVERLDSHGYVQTAAPDYTARDRQPRRRLPRRLGAHRRRHGRGAEGRGAAAGRGGAFFGFIGFGELVAGKPARRRVRTLC